MFIIEVLLWMLGIFVGLALLLWLTLFLMLLPGRKSKVKNFEWLFERPIAHRGYHKGNKEVPENSKAAYLAAIKKGYHIEIDVHLTKDNKVVLFHDGDLNRMCGVNKKIFESTYEELLQYPLMGGQEKIMELQEFLDLVCDQVGILIEFKDDFLDGKLEQTAYEILKNYKGRYVMQSFLPSSLRWFKKNAPEVARGQLCFNYMKNKKMSWVKKFLYTNLFSNFIGRPHFISYNWSGRNYYTVKVLRNLGAKLLVWSIINEEVYNQVKDECDNVIFENLDL